MSNVVPLRQKGVLTEKLGELKLAANVDDPVLQQHLAHVIRVTQPYDGELTADWLKTDFRAKQWKTTAGEKTRQNDQGEWIGTENVNWDIVLPDGTRLTDDTYADLLDTARRASFYFRLGLGDGHPPSLGSWKSFTYTVLSLCRWLVLYQRRYKPATHGMKLLDQTGLNQLARSLARGGWTEALELEQRCLRALYEGAYGQPIPHKLLLRAKNLPDEVCQRITGWVSEVGGYRYGEAREYRPLKAIKRTFLGQLVCAEAKSIKSNDRLAAVLRQFEPDFMHPHLLLSPTQRTLFPDQRTPELHVALLRRAKRGTLTGAMQHIGNLLQLYRHLSDRLPSPDSLKLQDATADAKHLCATPAHTPFIPINAGLQYLNGALRWVECYGDDFVDFYLSVFRQLKEKADNSKAIDPWYSATKYSIHDVIRNGLQPAKMREDGIVFTRWSDASLSAPMRERAKRCKTSHEIFNRSTDLSVQTALEVLVGSIITVIALLKPSRDVELAELPHDCLLDNGKGRYWLDSDLAKRTEGEQRATTGGKPIPVITAKAIQQMQRLGTGLKEIFGETDTYPLERLFYLPNPNQWCSAKSIDRHALNTYLDAFCDHIALPPDDKGRRWYLRIHEMRKWFLLLLFWSGRYDVMDAARWIAGHTNVEHLYAYIEREFPEAQLGDLEADFVAQQLEHIEDAPMEVDGETVGLVELHQRVLSKFGVKSLKLLEESKWKKEVRSLLEDEYHLEPYTITTDNGDQCIEVAIRAGKRKETA